jgi:polysaccharide export outer membrane protein
MKKSWIFGMIAVACLTAQAQETKAPPEPGAATNCPPVKLAPWQERLILGPGDILNLVIYDQPATSRQILVGPDGRFNYLQANNIEATGLTVDELRAKLEQIMAQYYLAPTLVINPEAFNSKKYILLGNIKQKGMFPLTKPVTLVEAIARGGGFENANNFVAADYAKSFVVRKEEPESFKRLPIDFEALFLRGDLSQNVSLAPDDYVYIAPLDIKEVYVLGEVGGPGFLPFNRETSVLQAVIQRGGFTAKAYRQRVLLVRGSLQQPTTIVVNTAAIMDGRAPDLPLKAGDIIYVSRKPWSYAQELLETAITAYISSAVVTWTGRSVPRMTDTPYIPTVD